MNTTEMTLAAKKRRLDQIERELTKQMEGFVTTGILLTEIRDDRLYEAAGHNSFKAYLAARGSRFGMSKRYAYRLISAASLRQQAAGGPAGHPAHVWTEKAMRPLAELAQEKPKEAKRVTKLIEREHTSGNGSKPISSAKVIDTLIAEGLRKKLPKPASSKAKRQNFDEVARGWIGRLNGIADVLGRGSNDELKWLREEHPDICNGLVRAIERVEKSVQRVWDAI